MKKIVKKIVFLLILACIIFVFYKINELNYTKHLEIRENIVNHPEGLPTKEFAVQTSFGYKNLRADFYRLQAIQYIGGNAISSEYKKYLFKMLDLITELNPFFEHPYVIGELLLPEYNPRYENLTKEEQNKTIEQGIKIGLKGMNNFCDKEKIEKIIKEDDLSKITEEAKYKNPCKTYTIPYYLGYIYFFYKKDPIKSSNYYKIASANSDSVEGSKIMSAIMQGKGGNRGKSFLMFIDMALNIGKGDKNCSAYAGYLLNIVKQNKKEIGYDEIIGKIDGEKIKEIGETREKVFGKFDEEKEKKNIYDSECSSYVNKSVRELNMAYVEIGNNKFKQKNNGNSARNAKVLFDEKYISFLPIDFQQYKSYGIIYEYNIETKSFDYKIGDYN